MEKEYVENFVQRNVFTVTTDEERRKHGIPLPMKLVFSFKKLIQKCRAVACGNFEKDPTTQLWTAQEDCCCQARYQPELADRRCRCF